MRVRVPPVMTPAGEQVTLPSPVEALYCEHTQACRSSDATGPAPAASSSSSGTTSVRSNSRRSDVRLRQAKSGEWGEREGYVCRG